ncbi:Trm112 family protein [Alteromonas sp. 1_MG-2023]|uniref:Trm112 family protein n=1 Tax=Alteromonas sp. 1_MG-2023 TaxID=3062669 RepID=UPI0026E32E7A|nr:Trm112 family protein [Alteromonas sp. 1_MG-2023]MDO6565996.1 Trm112 family protein [Alteromonas sp. 1_MG-2023]
MAFDNKLLEVLACPVCKGKLVLNEEKDKLICRFDRLAFDIIDGIPVLIESKATTMTLDEVDATR